MRKYVIIYREKLHYLKERKHASFSFAKGEKKKNHMDVVTMNAELFLMAL